MTRFSYGNVGYFWVVTFHRTFRTHVVWGQTWLRGSSCTAGDPADAAIAKSLYEEFGSGPSVSVPPPHHVLSPCDPG